MYSYLLEALVADAAASKDCALPRRTLANPGGTACAARASALVATHRPDQRRDDRPPTAPTVSRAHAASGWVVGPGFGNECPKRRQCRKNFL